MQTCQAYQSCPVCTHAWSPPLSRGVDVNGSCLWVILGVHKRWLTKDSSMSTRMYVRNLLPSFGTPILLSQFVLTIDTEKQPFFGHKFPPILCCLPEFDWGRIFGIPELIHSNIANTKLFQILGAIIRENIIMCEFPQTTKTVVKISWRYSWAKWAIEAIVDGTRTSNIVNIAKR